MKVEDGKVIEPCKFCDKENPDLNDDCLDNCSKGCFKTEERENYIDIKEFLKPRENNTLLGKLEKEFQRLKEFINENFKDDKKD